MKLSEAFESYRLDVIAFKNQSFKTEENHFVCLKALVNFFGDIDIESLDFNAIRKWKMHLEKKRGQNTVRNYIIKLRVVIKYHHKKRLDVIDPDLIPVPRRKRTVPLFLEKDEVTRLIEANDNIRQKLHRYRNKALISLLYASGIRVEECAQLTRTHIRIDNTFTVIGKGDKPRLCFIDDRTRNLLDDYLRLRTEGFDVMWRLRGKVTNRVRSHYKPDNEASLFLNNFGNRMTAADIQEVMKNSRRKAGISKHATPHTLRHSYATDLLRNNTNLRYVQAFLGHESLDTTQMYTHVVDCDLQAVYREKHTI